MISSRRWRSGGSFRRDGRVSERLGVHAFSHGSGLALGRRACRAVARARRSAPGPPGLRPVSPAADLVLPGGQCGEVRSRAPGTRACVLHGSKTRGE